MKPSELFQAEHQTLPAITILVIALLAALAIPIASFAGVQNITATNNVVAAGSTNLLSGTAAYFFAGKSTDITLQPTCTFTNASTNTFVFDGSADGANWVARIMTMTASTTATGTNTVCAGITNLPSALRYPFLRCWIENPSIYSTWTPKVPGFTKDGI